jgi:hypothetical protein
MADELDNIIPATVGDIRATHNARWSLFGDIEMRPTAIEKRRDEGNKIVRYPPGHSSETLRQRQHEPRIDDLFEKLEKLLPVKMPV